MHEKNAGAKFFKNLLQSLLKCENIKKGFIILFETGRKSRNFCQLLFYLELGIWAWRKYSQSDYAMRDSFCYSSCGPRAKHLAISNSFGTIFALKTPFCESHYSFMQIQHRRFIAGVAKNLLKALENCSYTTIKQSVVEQEALKPYME